jgi:hypothetical protein
MTMTMICFIQWMIVPAILLFSVITTTPVTEAQSLGDFLEADNGATLSKTALISKTIELNRIVERHRNRLLHMDATNDTYPHHQVEANDATNSMNQNDYDSISSSSTTVYTEERVHEVCQLIQDSFVSHSGTNVDPVTCNCMGSLHGTLTISCDYSESVCTDTTSTIAQKSSTTATKSSTEVEDATTKTCGKPQLGVTMVRGLVFSATTCISEYRRGLAEVPDTCVFVNACEDVPGTFCECTASHGGSICQTCEVCEGGKAISIDCTNINLDAISSTCEPIDLDLDVSHGAGSIAGFVPNFEGGFCSKLEATLDNKVVCDCSNVGSNVQGSTFEIKCQSSEEKCDEDDNNCGIVTSSIQIQSGIMSESSIMMSCAKYHEPFGETCTTFEFCTDQDNANSTSNSDATSTATTKLCGCDATYDGHLCNSCNVCNDGYGIQLDCSNIYEHAVMKECQAVTQTSRYEFVPKYSKQKSEAPESISSSTSSARSSPIKLYLPVTLIVSLSLIR